MAKQGLYGEKTIMVAFRVPESMVEDFRNRGYAILRQYSVNHSIKLASLSLNEVQEDNIKFMFDKSDNMAELHIKFNPSENINAMKKDAVYGVPVTLPIPIVKSKPIKEPTLITEKLYNTAKAKNIAGYGGLLKDEFSDKHYWKGDDGWFEFDSLKHITEYLTIKKP